MSEQNNPTENLKEIYNSEYCITLDELPDIRTYKSGEDPTSATTAASTAEALLKGDANCDAKVDISDAVLVLQSIQIWLRGHR